MNEDKEIVGSDCMCVLGSKKHQPDCEYAEEEITFKGNDMEIGWKLALYTARAVYRKWANSPEWSEISLEDWIAIQLGDNLDETIEEFNKDPEFKKKYKELTQPNPGSKEAVAKGCKCPVLDNEDGKGSYRGFIIRLDCKLHGEDNKKDPKFKKKYKKLINKELIKGEVGKERIVESPSSTQTTCACKYPSFGSSSNCTNCGGM